jgi:hypothetical protein
MTYQNNEHVGPNPNNPAGRLLTFLREVEFAMTIPVGELGAIPGYSDGSALARFGFIFGVDPRQMAEVHRLLSVILSLPQQMVAMGQDDETWQAKYRDTARQAEEYLRNITSNLRDAGLYAPAPGLVTLLEFCDTLLSKVSLESVLDQSAIEALLVQIDELLEFVRGSGLDEDLAGFVIKGLLRLRTAISYYKFSGVAGIQDEVERFVGGLYINQEKHSESADSAEGVSVMSRVGKFMALLFGQVFVSAASITITQLILGSGH